MSGCRARLRAEDASIVRGVNTACVEISAHVKVYSQNASHDAQLLHKTRIACIQPCLHGATSRAYSTQRSSSEVACTAMLLSFEYPIIFSQTFICSVTMVTARYCRKQKCCIDCRSECDGSYRIHVRYIVFEKDSSLGCTSHYHVRYRSVTIGHPARVLTMIDRKL